MITRTYIQLLKSRRLTDFIIGPFLEPNIDAKLIKSIWWYKAWDDFVLVELNELVYDHIVFKISQRFFILVSISREWYSSADFNALINGDASSCNNDYKNKILEYWYPRKSKDLVWHNSTRIHHPFYYLLFPDELSDKDLRSAFADYYLNINPNLKISEPNLFPNVLDIECSVYEGEPIISTCYIFFNEVLNVFKGTQMTVRTEIIEWLHQWYPKIIDNWSLVFYKDMISYLSDNEILSSKQNEQLKRLNQRIVNLFLSIPQGFHI